MKTSDFYYDLPERLIAQHPLEERTSSRLLVLDKNTGAILHRHFSDLPEFLKAGDVLVINNTRVIPARLLGARSDTGSAVEILLLKRLDDYRWETLARPGKKVTPGKRITFIPNELEAECEQVLEDGNRIMRFDFDGIWEEILDRAGIMPLPPYIHEQLKDNERYQTVYSKFEGSAAAPTAGLHFSKELMSKLKSNGIIIAEDGTVVVDQTVQDFRSAVLVVSLAINLVILITWIVLQLTTQYDAALLQAFLSR